jgi:tetratricopeptide (TPR) repeat protein
VRRWDNLVNLFQRIAEAVLFFHPAVWIVSRWVRLEREQCCDEIVLRHRDAPQKYAETLAALAVPGISPVHAAAAMANHQLVARIRNILNVEDRTMRFSARSLLVAVGSIALLVGLTFVAGPLVADEQPTAKPAAPSSDKVNDQTSTPKQEKFLFKVDVDGRESVPQRELLWALKDSSASQAANGQKRPWGPEQACGAPDTLQPGDVPTAWASATPDGQREWLEVDFGEQIDGVALVVYENNAPGAVDKICVLGETGVVTDVHGVKDPTPTTAPSGVSIFPLVASAHGVRIETDSANVPGWNEIDAVGLLDKQGQVHWAKTAKASSTFADAAGYDKVAGDQQYAVFAGDVTRFRPMMVALSDDVEIDQDVANDPEIARLRKSIEEIEQGLRGISVTGDAAQQELAKKRIRRAELRKKLLTEEIEDRTAQLRQQREAAMAQYKQATAVEQQTRAAAERALYAEQMARANAAKAEADRAQAQAQLQAAADANRKLENELAALKQQAAAQKALAEQTNQRRERIKLYDYYQKLEDGQSSVRLDPFVLSNAKQNLGIVADKLGAELKALDRQAQSASNTGRAQIAERMQKLHDQLDGIQSTLQLLDKNLQDETTRATRREETPRPPPTREDRAALERIEQLEKAVQELRRAQQNKQNPPAVPGTPREY